MTGLLKQFVTTIEADLRQLFDKKEHNNPIELLNKYIREAEKQTEQTAKWLGRQGQLREKFERELMETSTMLEKRTAQLSLAKTSGEEDLILFAQEEVQAYKTRHAKIQASLDTTTKEYFELERKFETMKHKMKDMKVRQLQLMGKENVTRAHHQINEVIQQNADQSGDRFSQLESYIEKLGQQIEEDYQTTSYEQRLQSLENKAIIDVPVK